MNRYLRNITQAGRAFGRAVMGSTSGFEAASRGHQIAGWTELDSAIDTLMASEGDSLRSKSRGLVRKNSWAKNAEEIWVANMIGTGIKPESLHPDKEVRALVQKSWKRWTDEADADGLTDIYGLQALVMRENFEAGETLIRFRPRFEEDGLSVPLQLQVIEAEHLSLTHFGNNGGNAIRSGIEFTPFGKRAAYHLYREHPGLGHMSKGLNPGEMVRVDAANVIHSFDVLRAGQMRGTPWLAPVMVALYELDQYVDATLKKQKISNMFVGWYRGMSDEIAATLMADARSQNSGETAPTGVAFGEVQPATILDLSAGGGTLEWSTPPDPSSSFPDFVKAMLRMIACGVGVPYTRLNWDTSDSTFASERSELLEFRRRVEQKQFSMMAFQVCRPIWRRWIKDAVLVGVLPKPRTPAEWNDLYSVEWRTPKWAWVDPLKDVMAAKEAVRCSFTSRTAQIHELGYDPEQVDAEIAADNERADRLGIVSDSDPRKTQDNGGARAASADEQPTSGKQGANKNG